MAAARLQLGPRRLQELPRRRARLLGGHLPQQQPGAQALSRSRSGRLILGSARAADDGLQAFGNLQKVSNRK